MTSVLIYKIVKRFIVYLTNRHGPLVKPVKSGLRAPKSIGKFGAPISEISHWCSSKRAYKLAREHISILEMLSSTLVASKRHSFCIFAVGVLLL